jgi:eukaryotic-like serine/threonine-protein kinase
MPDRLGRYPVHRRIGSGAFATVWLAHDEQLDSPVAVKVLADNWAGDELIRQRFLEEGRYLRRVESPHVVTVYDAGELDDGRPYLVMTFADQGTLADRLEADPPGGRLTTPQALTVIREVAAGLQALHDRGVLHRDVKPANVLFRSIHAGTDVRAMVGDLGLGKALDMSSRLTLAGGTPSFVAPEQAAGAPLDQRADQYSLAALAYLLLTGRRPFSHLDLHAAADPGPVPSLSTPERHFDAAVEAVVRRGLDRRPGERYPTVTDFSAALAGALLESTGETPAITSPGLPWLPMDPQLTVLGSRPAAQPASAVPSGAVPEPGHGTEPAAPASLPPRRGGRWRRGAALAAAAVVAAAAAGGAAYALGRNEAVPSGSATLTDATGSLSVTVPAAWERFVSRKGWVPPGQPDGARKDYPALWAGSTAAWNDVSASAEGVFLAVLPSTQLPGHLPRHPECDGGGDQVVGKDPQGGDQATARYTGCPAGVVIEQATMLARDRLLWVQVHGDSVAQASEVLRTVDASGLNPPS